MTDDDCVDGGSCDHRGSCVFFVPGCSGPTVESVRIVVFSAWTYPDLYELDVPTGRLGATLERRSVDGGTAPRDGGVVFIDAGAWPDAPAWCPYIEALEEGCAADVAGFEVEVSGGGQSNRFSYSSGASRRPGIDPLLIDLFWQFAHADAGLASGARTKRGETRRHENSDVGVRASAYPALAGLANDPHLASMKNDSRFKAFFAAL